MEFWSELLTKESWEKLVGLAKEAEFILIGGWAAYLHTGQHKSKDIDIIVDLKQLRQLKDRYELRKNEHLKKYEIKLEKFDIDIYVPYFSELALPIEELIKQTVIIKGITTLKPEALLILKQGAEIDRRGSVKGKKDAIDILTILAYAGVDWKLYSELAKRHKKEKYIDRLIAVINEFSDKDIKYLGMDFLKFKKWKRDILKILKGL